MLKDALAVALGGALGSVLRWLVSSAFARSGDARFPWGTLVVNLVGSFVIGVVLGWGHDRGPLAPTMRLLVVTGVLGGFTTFSALSWETLALARSGQPLGAIGYGVGSLAGGLLAASAGWALMRR
jgi:CrcB protein